MKFTLYVIRKSYADIDSQVAAYKNHLENAIANCPKGYNVYNAINGEIIYSNIDIDYIKSLENNEPFFKKLINIKENNKMNKYERMWKELADYIDGKIESLDTTPPTTRDEKLNQEKMKETMMNAVRKSELLLTLAYMAKLEEGNKDE